MLWISLLACSMREQPAPPETGLPTETAAETGPLEETAAPGPCPVGMALVGELLCVDRWEASLEVQEGEAWVAVSPYEVPDGRLMRARSRAGEVPAGYLSGDQAEAACVAAGKRLCTSEEWLGACQGASGWTYPYGEAHVDGACNDRYAGGHPVVDLFGTNQGVWDSVHMNDPRINQQPNTLAASGAYAGCVTPTGIHDLHGNLHEWVSDMEGTFRGGFYADASLNGPGCTYRTTAHTRTYHDYSTGFRCCADAQ